MSNLVKTSPEPLVQFMPIFIDRLLTLMVRPPQLGTIVVNVSQACFETIGALVGKISVGK